MSFTALAAVLLGVWTGGCGQPALGEADAPRELPNTPALLQSANGFSRLAAGTNGMGTNGMGTNGMGTNGLSTLGLSGNAMNQSAFITWFNQDTALANMVMHYVVACGVPDGSSLVWTNPSTGLQYVWTGVFGLTPGWASGLPASEAEQQLITACLAAHTNIYRLHVSISVQGRNADGTPIPVEPLEFTTFAQREGCFFGNIFTGEGVYSGSDGVLPSSNSSVRACGLEMLGVGDKCSPIRHVGSCSQLCTPDLQGNSYESCSYNGKDYRAITTRIRTQDINTCGDGVCQVSESCGYGLTPDNCMDCGPCP